MARYSFLSSLFAALCLWLVGCGSEQNELRTPYNESTAGEGAPASGTSPQEHREDGAVTAQNSCLATCKVQDLGGGMCPSIIRGSGYSTFQGCMLPCKKAKDDAVSRLPAGCLIDTCNFSGCYSR